MDAKKDDFHSFDVSLAVELGVEKAILIGNFHFWITENEQRKSVNHFRAGEYWTYDSAKSLAEKYPYFHEKSIARWTKELIDSGWLKRGRYNTSVLDKTTWFGRGERMMKWFNTPISQNKESIPQNEITIPQNEECIAQNEECIYKDTDIKHTDIKQQQKAASAAAAAVVTGFAFACKKINEVRSDVLAARIMREDAMMKLALTADHYTRLVNGFFDEQIALAETGESIIYSQLRKHVKNWIRSQVLLGTASAYHPDYRAGPQTSSSSQPKPVTVARPKPIEKRR